MSEAILTTFPVETNINEYGIVGFQINKSIDISREFHIYFPYLRIGVYSEIKCYSWSFQENVPTNVKPFRHQAYLDVDKKSFKLYGNLESPIVQRQTIACTFRAPNVELDNVTGQIDLTSPPSTDVLEPSMDNNVDDVQDVYPYQVSFLNSPLTSGLKFQVYDSTNETGFSLRASKFNHVGINSFTLHGDDLIFSNEKSDSSTCSASLASNSFDVSVNLSNNSLLIQFPEKITTNDVDEFKLDCLSQSNIRVTVPAKGMPAILKISATSNGTTDDPNDVYSSYTTTSMDTSSAFLSSISNLYIFSTIAVAFVLLF